MVKNFKSGFTIIELTVVIAIVSIVLSVVISNFSTVVNKSDLNSGFQEFANVVRLAQNKTLSSENISQFGVYLNTSVSPHKYILFKGATYASRDTSYDQAFSLPPSTEFYSINLSGGNEVVFSKLTGSALPSGNVSVRSKVDTSQVSTVYISASGTIGFTAPSTPSDSARVKDSRHLHFDYSRNINTATETITLNFNNGQTTQSFPINVYLSAGQLNWKGTINVGGSNQTVEIRTHSLNNPTSQFSIHRDRRYNNKSLKVTISGDSSGHLANYSADGLTTDYSSIYVSNFNSQ